MVDQEEIILMTKLALHEKKYGRVDKKRNSYFKWDYIYINNWYTRVAVGIGMIILMAWMMFTDVYIDEIIPVFDVDLGEYLYEYIVFFILTIVVYTAFSTWVFNKKYEATQERLAEYDSLLKELDIYQKSKELHKEDLHHDVE